MPSNGAYPDPKLRSPSKTHWARAVKAGFGSDGSSMSSDTIFGVEIGKTSRKYLPGLPANRHDFRYFCGGLVGTRLLADLEYMHGCIAATDKGLTGWKAPLRVAARWRARRRFHVLRRRGHMAWDAHRKAGHRGPQAKGELS